MADMVQRLAWPFPWDAGVPRPVCLAAEGNLYLVYRVSGEVGESARPQSVRVGAGNEVFVATRFAQCLLSTFGQPFPDALVAHRLKDKGLTSNTAHVVLESTWKREWLTGAGKVFQSDLELLSRANHYALTFHDEILECIATNLEHTVLCGNEREACQWAVDRLWEQIQAD